MLLGLPLHTVKTQCDIWYSIETERRGVDLTTLMAQHQIHRAIYCGGKDLIFCIKPPSQKEFECNVTEVKL